ncbi:MAG: hypothetical protein M1813_007926 [Trichoglossum hirsutum]|nr:MAG: hypothetical protein M1813_007926 [Trichoglossum hirsutum]
MVRVTAQTVLGLIFLTSGALAMPAFLEEPSLIPTAAKPAPTTESQAPVPTPTAGSPAPLDIPLSALEAAPVLDAAADLDAPAPNNGSLTKRTGPFTCYPGITGNAPLQDFVWLGGAQKACTTWFGPNMNQVHYV